MSQSTGFRYLTSKHLKIIEGLESKFNYSIDMSEYSFYESMLEVEVMDQYGKYLELRDEDGDFVYWELDLTQPLHIFQKELYDYLMDMMVQQKFESK